MRSASWLAAELAVVPVDLVTEAELLALLAPHRWLSLSVEEVDDTSAPLLAALIGERAMRTLRRTGDIPGLAVDVSGCAPWLRVAVVDALDRWLHLPLDQSLVDAERVAASRRGHPARRQRGAPAGDRRRASTPPQRLDRSGAPSAAAHALRRTNAGAVALDA